MKRIILLLALFLCNAAAAKEVTFKLGRFGDVVVYRSELKEPSQLILFLSGDGGWAKGVVDMAKALSQDNAVVVGISTPRYLKNLKGSRESCHYPASDLESLSHYLQKKLGLKQYLLPTIVGYSSGATLAYAVLAQSPAHTFKAGLSLGFCPDFEIDKPLCKGAGLTMKPRKPRGYDLDAARDLKTPFYVLNGFKDKVCTYEAQKNFLAQIPLAQLITLPEVGHGFAATKNWMPQLLRTSQTIAAAPDLIVKPSAELGELPLIEEAAAAAKDPLVIVLSGDGGWASIDKELAEALNKVGYSIIGIDSLRYFWQEKSPEQLASDLQLVAAHYMKAWHKTKVLWIGYSMGADVLPFAINLFPPALRAATRGAAFLSLGRKAQFEMHLSSWLISDDGDEGTLIKPVLEGLDAIDSLCLYGDQESSSGCEGIKRKNFKALAIPGGHHFAGEYEKLAQMILEHFRI